MSYKFERLEVYQLALQLLDTIYETGRLLPGDERYNLRDQMVRAGTSIVLNIAEGSTGQSDAEQGRFLNMAIRSLLEVVACLHIIERRRYVEPGQILQILAQTELLFARLSAFKKAITIQR